MHGYSYFSHVHVEKEKIKKKKQRKRSTSKSNTFRLYHIELFHKKTKPLSLGKQIQEAQL